MAYYLSKIKTPYTLSMHACGAEVEWSASAATGQLKRDHIYMGKGNRRRTHRF